MSNAEQEAIDREFEEDLARKGIVEDAERYLLRPALAMLESYERVLYWMGEGDPETAKSFLPETSEQ